MIQVPTGNGNDREDVESYNGLIYNNLSIIENQLTERFGMWKMSPVDGFCMDFNDTDDDRCEVDVMNSWIAYVWMES